MGRLHPFRIWRIASRVLRLGLLGPARTLIRQSLQIWWRLRYGSGAGREGAAIRVVRNTAARWRGGWDCRPDRDLAHWPAHRWAGGRAYCPRAARGMSALLRSHVHECEG